MLSEDNKYIKIAREIILSLIDKDNISVFLYGSRAAGKEKHYSDLDIGLWSTNKIDRTLIRKINDSIEESIVPYHIDVIDFTIADEKFKKIALREIEIWNKGKGFNLN